MINPSPLPMYICTIKIILANTMSVNLTGHYFAWHHTFGLWITKVGLMNKHCSIHLRTRHFVANFRFEWKEQCWQQSQNCSHHKRNSVTTAWQVYDKYFRNVSFSKKGLISTLGIKIFPVASSWHFFYANKNSTEGNFCLFECKLVIIRTKINCH